MILKYASLDRRRRRYRPIEQAGNTLTQHFQHIWIEAKNEKKKNGIVNEDIFLSSDGDNFHLYTFNHII